MSYEIKETIKSEVSRLHIYSYKECIFLTACFSFGRK